MFRPIKFYFIFFVSFYILCISTQVFAKAIMAITVNEKAVILSKSGNVSLHYTLTNDTTQMLNNLTFFIFNGIDNASVKNSISLQKNTCVGNLQAGASCTFQILLTGYNDLPSSFIMSPVVCAYNNLICSQPDASNRVTVSVMMNDEKVAYITNTNNFTSTSVLICNIETNGDLTNCEKTGNGFDGPIGIAINKDKTFVYVANGNNGTISKCSIDVNNKLVDCAMTTNGFNYPESIIINSSNTSAYVSDLFDVWACQINSITQDLINCNPSGINVMTNRYGISVSSNNLFGYVSNFNAGTISVCRIDENNNFSCTSKDGYIDILGITNHPISNLMYLVNALDANVSKCNINSIDGDLINCSPTATGSNANGGIIINSSGLLAYIINSNSDVNGVTKCSLTTNGDLVNCVPTGTCAITNPFCFSGQSGIVLK